MRIMWRSAIMPALRSNVRCAALAASVWLTSPLLAQAQGDSVPGAAHTGAQGTHDAGGQESTPVGPEYPALHISGFANIDFASQPKSEGPRGFTEGQFVLHLAAALAPRVSFFGEVSFTPRTDAGTGNPPAAGFNAEVERSIIRFDASDELKISFGRYHTPINWWNTAFHHGLWLQTTISRPEMIQFGGKFLPVHFVGALAEGAFPAGGWNLNYQAGMGNGRWNVISRPGDAGDNNDRPAWVMNVFVKPDSLLGLQVGGSAYFDRISVPGQPEYNEQIVSAHVVWLHEDPEVLAEIADVRHTPVGNPDTESSLAYYVQGAYRLPGAGRLFKPYYRFEHNGVNANDPAFAGVVLNLDTSTLGIRYDISNYVAIKTEERVFKQAVGQPWMTGWYFQVAFTF